VPRAVNRRRLLISLGLATGLVLMVLAFSLAETGGNSQNLPEGLESVAPASGAQVPRQTDIVADLAPGYDGVLFMQPRGEIPADQVSFDDGLNQLIFPCRPILNSNPQGSSGANVARPPQPRCIRNDPNAELLQVPRGVVLVRVEYWKITEGRSASKQYSWSFTTS
jgi:hypothetical protein